MKILDKCKIGQLVYSISIVEGLSEEDEPLFGDVTYKTQEIRLDSGMSVERTRAVLLHEIIHALLEISCSIENCEESFVQAFGMALFNFMSENKDVVKFIMGVK